MRRAPRPARSCAPVRYRSTASAAPAAAVSHQITSAPSSSSGNDSSASVSFINALERKTTNDRAHTTPIDVSPARKEAMKAFSTKITSSIKTNLPAARNYYELAKALKCISPETCAELLPISLRENDRRWTVTIYTDWDTLAPGAVPIDAVNSGFRALATFGLWPRLKTMLESVHARGLRLPDSSVQIPMRSAAGCTHPEAHEYVLTAMRLGYAAERLVDSVMKRAPTIGHSDSRVDYFVKAMELGDLPTTHALEVYCEILEKIDAGPALVKLLSAAQLRVQLTPILRQMLVEAAARTGNLTALENALVKMRKSDPSRVISRKLIAHLVTLAIRGDCCYHAKLLQDLVERRNVNILASTRQFLQVMRLVSEGKQAEASAVYKTIAPPRPHFPDPRAPPRQLLAGAPLKPSATTQQTTPTQPSVMQQPTKEEST